MKSAPLISVKTSLTHSQTEAVCNADDKKLRAPVSRPRRRFGIRALGRDTRGTAAIEFSIIALPFFLIIFGAFEVGINYLANRMLNAGTDQVARMIRTGQIKATTFTEAQFKQELCNKGSMFLFKCSDLIVDVKEVANFDTEEVPKNPDGTLDDSQMGFAPGGRLTINVVRVYYEWPNFINWGAQGVDEWSGSKRLIVGTAAFMNEPFS